MRALDVKRAIVAAVTILSLASGAGAAGAPAPRPAGVDWGAGHFSTPEALKIWLADRGVRYQDWLQLHPRGAYLMTHSARASGGSRAGAQLPPRARESGFTAPAKRTIYGLAAALLLLALTPSSMLVRVMPMRHDGRLTPARTTLAAAGFSLVLGVIVASLL
jgi:hypothetical protein